MESKETVPVAIGNNPVRQEGLPKLLHFYGMPLWRRLLLGRKEEVQLLETQYVLHPFWFIKVAAYADRLPFSPKLRRHVLYIDAVTGERGLTDRFPEIEKKTRTGKKIVPPLLKDEDVKQMTEELIENLILRTYLLKRPRIEVAGRELVYLPHYQVRVNVRDGEIHSLSVNALSGEVKKLSPMGASSKCISPKTQ